MTGEPTSGIPIPIAVVVYGLGNCSDLVEPSDAGVWKQADPGTVDLVLGPRPGQPLMVYRCYDRPIAASEALRDLGRLLGSMGGALPPGPPAASDLQQILVDVHVLPALPAISALPDGASDHAGNLLAAARFLDTNSGEDGQGRSWARSIRSAEQALRAVQVPRAVPAARSAEADLTAPATEREGPQPKRSVTITLNAKTLDLLAVVGVSVAVPLEAPDARVRSVLYHLAHTAAAGVLHPESWEHGWLKRVFGDEWIVPSHEAR
jgi:hypothetical protein